MGKCKKITVKCNRYPGTTNNFIADFVLDKDNNIAVLPINICNMSDNSDICFKCAGNLWLFLTGHPDVPILSPVDPLTLQGTARNNQ